MNELSYLDYLPGHPYEDLPDQVRQTIDRDAYEHYRNLASELADGETTELPGSELLAAYRQSVRFSNGHDEGARTRVQRQLYPAEGGEPRQLYPAESGEPRQLYPAEDEEQGKVSSRRAGGRSLRPDPRRNRLRWLAAAGWLLFLLAGAWYIFRTPAPPAIVYRDVPVRIIDTIVQRRTDTLRSERVVYRNRVVRDTVWRKVPAPVTLVYLYDTIYLPADTTQISPRLVSGSSTLAGRGELLELLYAAE